MSVILVHIFYDNHHSNLLTEPIVLRNSVRLFRLDFDRIDFAMIDVREVDNYTYELRYGGSN